MSPLDEVHRARSDDRGAPRSRPILDYRKPAEYEIVEDGFLGARSNMRDLKKLAICLLSLVAMSIVPGWLLVLVGR